MAPSAGCTCNGMVRPQTEKDSKCQPLPSEKSCSPPPQRCAQRCRSRSQLPRGRTLKSSDCRATFLDAHEIRTSTTTWSPDVQGFDTTQRWRMNDLGSGAKSHQQVSSGRFLGHEIAELDFRVVTRPQQGQRHPALARGTSAVASHDSALGSGRFARPRWTAPGRDPPTGQ
jgi:hypothetical protein